MAGLERFTRANGPSSLNQVASEAVSGNELIKTVGTLLALEFASTVTVAAVSWAIEHHGKELDGLRWFLLQLVLGTVLAVLVGLGFKAARLLRKIDAYLSESATIQTRVLEQLDHPEARCGLRRTLEHFAFSGTWQREFLDGLLGAYSYECRNARMLGKRPVHTCYATMKDAVSKTTTGWQGIHKGSLSFLGDGMPRGEKDSHAYFDVLVRQPVRKRRVIVLDEAAKAELLGEKKMQICQAFDNRWLAVNNNSAGVEPPTRNPPSRRQKKELGRRTSTYPVESYIIDIRVLSAALPPPYNMRGVLENLDDSAIFDDTLFLHYDRMREVLAFDGLRRGRGGEEQRFENRDANVVAQIHMLLDSTPEGEDGPLFTRLQAAGDLLRFVDNRLVAQSQKASATT